MISYQVIALIYNILSLGRKETFYFYQCSTCMNKTAYCVKCNKTMDLLLNGVFFKCFVCKVLTKIIHRESISPEHENVNRLLFKVNDQLCNIDNDVKGLFQPTINMETYTPMRNLFGPSDLRFNSTTNTMNIGAMNVPGKILFKSKKDTNIRLNQNLMKNFNQSEGLQTPKMENKFEKSSIMFSPDDKFQTPNSNKWPNSGNCK
jgi:hypothetical protein